MHQEKGCLIQNLYTRQFLDIKGESTEPGATVIQWTKTGNSNQLWLPEPVGNGAYRIRSLHAPSLFLNIRAESIKDGAKLEVNNELTPAAFWLIEGALP